MSQLCVNAQIWKCSWAKLSLAAEMSVVYNCATVQSKNMLPLAAEDVFPV